MAVPGQCFNDSPLLPVSPAGHLEPVQFLFYPMKGIVADRVTGAHGENGLPGGLDGSATGLAVCGARRIASVRLAAFVCQTRGELLPDEPRDR